MYPKLYIGNSIHNFLKDFKGIIHTVSTSEELDNLLREYSNTNSYPYDFAISDISLIPNLDILKLINFLDSSSLNIVLLCRYDITSNLLLSKIKYLSKNYPLLSSNFKSLEEAFKEYQYPEDYITKNEIQNMIQISPILYFSKQYYPRKFRLLQRVYESDN